MKKISRDFTLTISVPDDVEPEDCEIVIHNWGGSYNRSHESVPVDEEEAHLRADDPYEQE